jgi:hypothetical protein
MSGHTGDGARMTDEELDAKLFDYYEGNLSPEERAAVEAVLVARGEPLAKDDDEKYRSGLETLKAARPAPPPTFTQDVTDTIHVRSAGRFFGRRTFGDRVPFGIVLALAVVVAIVVAAILWSSETGSLSVRKPPEPTAPPPGAKDSLAPPEP